MRLVAVVFEDETTAFDMRVALVKMQMALLIDLEDVVRVKRDQKGKVELNQTLNLTARGAVGGGFWGMQEFKPPKQSCLHPGP